MIVSKTEGEANEIARRIRSGADFSLIALQAENGAVMIFCETPLFAMLATS